MEFLDFPFMQRAMIAGVALGLVLPLLGSFVTLRRMSFFGDGIAHASLAGVAIGIVAGLNPFWVAIAAGIAFGILVYFLERKTSLSSDAIIGIIFTAGMALGIVLLSMRSGYRAELMSFLFGNILTISTHDLLIISGFVTIIIVFLALFVRQLTLLILDREAAWLSGIPTGVLEFIFYIVISLAAVLGVKLLGIILVSALLIIPPTIAKLLAKSFRRLLVFSVIAGELSVIAGLIISYYLGLPSGATIILTGAGIFFLVLFAKQFIKELTLRKKTG